METSLVSIATPPKRSRVCRSNTHQIFSSRGISHVREGRSDLIQFLKTVRIFPTRIASALDNMIQVSAQELTR